jgi:hypothetical protein
MFAHITRTVKVISALAITQVLIACGGGGGGETTAVVVDPKTKETAMEIRLASTLVEVNSMGTIYIRSRLDKAYVDNTWKATPVTTDGCMQFGVTNPDTIPSLGDSRFYNNTKCVYPYKGDTGALTQTATGLYELIAISDPNLPNNAAWIYEDKLTTTSQLTFKLNLSGKINFNGERTDKGIQTQKTTALVDGSQIDILTVTATSRETSDFGVSEVSISGNISCKYAVGILVNGDCSASTGTLTGTIYGTNVNSTMHQLAGLPETHEISYGDKKITIIVNKIDLNEPSLNQFTIKTSTGETFSLTGEETGRLRFY